MKYFTYEIVAAANMWIEQTDEEFSRAEKLFWSKVDDYHIELESLTHRVSRKAWNFFRYGFGENGLHDGRLLSLSVGDGLNYSPDGAAPFLLNFQRLSARIEFLNYEQNFHYTFNLQRLKSIDGNLFTEKDSFAQSIGDLSTYELTEADKDTLQLSFLFASGASITAQFRKLVFQRKRVKRKYEIGEIYNLKRGKKK